MSDDRRERASRYRRLHLSVWGDDKFRTRLSPQKPSGQTLWLYLLQGPHTSSVPGLWHAGQRGMAESLGWPIGAFRRCWREIADAGMAEADWSNQVVWVPKAFQYNPPDNPNVIAGWRPWLAEIPECELKRRGLNALEQMVEGLGESFIERFRQLLRKQDQ